MSEDTNCSAARPKQSLSSRFWDFMHFGFAYVARTPKKDENFRIILRTRICFSDRLRILVSGWIYQDIVVETDVQVNEATTHVAFSVMPPFIMRERGAKLQEGE